MSKKFRQKENKKERAKRLNLVVEQTRSQILEVTKTNGGHLSANLGVVETTVALHDVFDFSVDKLIFDVGHQCYAHKILSDRKDKFCTLRQKGGISGFPDAEESPFDAFSTGHAGTSLSASLGVCEARDRLGQDFYVIAVVGDGSLVNGLNLEALTSSINKPKKLIVILNDNGMSISKNRNGFYKMISKSTTQKGYVKSKRFAKKLFGKNFIGKILGGVRNLSKRLISGGNYFEKFGFKYVGVLDGNDVEQMTDILRRVKNVAKDKAVFVHVNTTKGKGLSVAEESAELYHGVGKDFSLGSGSMSKALGECLCAQIEKNDKILAVTAGMKQGTGLWQVEEKYPNNFIDVGIAEEFAVTFSAGMAKSGLKPVVAIYSTFMQRAYDQIMHDVCMQNLPVVFCLDRAGFVGEDGRTHQGLFDLSFLSHLPNLTILSPINEYDLKLALDYALSLNSPVAIRYAKEGARSEVELKEYSQDANLVVKEGTDVEVLAVGGRMLDLALEFAKASPRSVKVRAIRKVNSLDGDLQSLTAPMIITLEENAIKGGFGSLIRQFIKLPEGAKIVCLGAKDDFVKHGTVKEQFIDSDLTLENLLAITNI